MYKSLREFISLLDETGELVRIKAFVDPVEEIAEITDRMSKGEGGGKALLFENTGTAFPVVTNMFGSRKRMALALGVDSLDDIPVRIERMIKKMLSPKPSFSDKLQALPVLGEASRWFPKNVKGRGACQQVVLSGDDAGLGLLPILKCWEHDGGRFVTLPLVNTADPETGIRNVGMYRMQIFDDHTTGMHWHMHKTGAKHYEMYRRLGRKMPVSVCLGGDPAYTYSAVAPMPEGMDEYLLAGFLRNKPVRLVKCITNDLYVPEDCDFVIEGYVDTSEEKVVEGPFGDHTGFYSLEDLYPGFHVTAVTHRRDAVYPATIVGIPPQEDLYIAEATEKIFLAPIRLAMQPEITDLYMPPAGTAHNLAIVNIDKSYPGQAHKVASSLWGAGQMMFDKYLIVTSTDKDIRDPETIAELVRGADMESAVISGSGILDILDHSTATPGFGGKLALDFTGSAGAVLRKDIPLNTEEFGGADSVDTSLLGKWAAVILRGNPDSIIDARRFVDANAEAGLKCVLITDPVTEGLSPYELLWLATANSDPRRDTLLYKGVLIADSRTKLPDVKGNPRRFPNVVASSEKIISSVDGRWDEYGIGEFIVSPSKRYRALMMSDKAEI